MFEVQAIIEIIDVVAEISQVKIFTDLEYFGWLFRYNLLFELQYL